MGNTASEASAKLWQIISPFLDLNFKLHSRMHPMNNWLKGETDQQIFIKREDELSAGITGSKYRKFASLMPWIQSYQPDEVWIAGGNHSNHVVGLMQLLNEFNIPYRLWLLEDHQSHRTGNRLLLDLLMNNQASIEWIHRSDWPDLKRIIEAHQAEKRDQQLLYIPEGGAMKEALPGLLTQPLNLTKNLEDWNIHVDHIFTDSGTGITSAALLWGLGFLGYHQVHVHITLIAGDQSQFENQLQQLKIAMIHLTGETLDVDLPVYSLHQPATAPSFGSINKTVLSALKSIAREEGILMDPVYTVKHLLTVKNILTNRATQGNAMILYNGGALGMMGFQDRLWP
ncbi:MAG: hypothetical protein BRD49_03910 [Bacteroidetes bacterium SW_10_40_5]|nr:MAG: hypothetical protein BRD49_03910 [Bacteroidetes bacterium SW_10_40_5]